MTMRLRGSLETSVVTVAVLLLLAGCSREQDLVRVKSPCEVQALGDGSKTPLAFGKKFVGVAQLPQVPGSSIPVSVQELERCITAHVTRGWDVGKDFCPEGVQFAAYLHIRRLLGITQKFLQTRNHLLLCFCVVFL